MLNLVILACMAALPEGSAPPALNFPHFPSRMHTYVWRNWTLVPEERAAATIGATVEQYRDVGASMGLGMPPAITEDQLRRSYITIIRRNWHLLPYDQLLQLLGWTEAEMAYTLREDDFLYVKLGLLKPKCGPLRFAPPTPEQQARARDIATVARPVLESVPESQCEPLFQFVKELSSPVEGEGQRPPSGSFSPRICHSYFALYGDTLLHPEPDPYPDGYLQRLAATGVDGVWLQGVLFKLAPFPWDETLSEGRETRLENLRKLVARAKKHGIGVWLYLNEPRSMPQAFFADREGLKGVSEGDFASLCTNVPEVRDYLRNSIALICRDVPDLAGFFTISGSENLTHCWSHYQGSQCPRCSGRGAAPVVAELHASIQQGIDDADSNARLIAWDWGWQDAWAQDAIAQLPKAVSLMSVSEWSLPIERGGVKTSVGEYSISAIGPGPRATAHWSAARAAGLRPLAKLQLGTTWELGAVPYIPAVANVAVHMERLRGAGVEGALLGWTLGGHPSPNLEVAAQILGDPALDADTALLRVAEQRHGPAAEAVVAAWKTISAAFQELPYDGAPIYQAPFQQGPSNLLWGVPTGYKATMVGIPYDDARGWCGAYPPEVFAAQLDKVADGFEAAVASLKSLKSVDTRALARERGVMEACAIHYRAAAVQTRFVLSRDGGADAAALRGLIEAQRGLAARLYGIQSRDARIGYEATNHYFYVPMDLVESVLNCEYLLDAWPPAQAKQ